MNSKCFAMALMCGALPFKPRSTPRQAAMGILPSQSSVGTLVISDGTLVTQIRSEIATLVSIDRRPRFARGTKSRNLSP